MKSSLNDFLPDRISEIFNKELFFVVGVPKSGTTWLQRTLDANPEIVCRGESHFVNILYPALSSALDNYERDQLNSEGLRSAADPGNDDRSVSTFEPQDTDYLLVSAMALMFKKWLNKPGVKHIGEKTPNNVKFLQVLGSIFPDSRFIHIIRDGRDAAVSGWFFNISNMERSFELRDTMETYVTRFAGVWNDLIRDARALGHQYGPRYREVFYEDLVADPYEEIRSLFEFLGADSSPDVLRTCIESNRFERLSGGRRPGEEKRDAFFRKGVPGDWRNHMNVELSEAFRVRAGELLESLGYSKD